MPTADGPWDLGDVVPLGVNIYNTAGALADATSVAVTITLPDATTSTPSVTHGSTGVYTATYTPASAGRYTERWVATGTNASTYVDNFEVIAVAEAPICSLADARTVMAISDTTWDEEIRALAIVASEIVEQKTQVWRRQTITSATFDGGKEFLQLRRPVVSVTTVVESDTTLTSSDYVLDAARGRLYRGTTLIPMCWYWGRQNVSVTYVAGLSSGNIPEPIRYGTALLTQHLWKRRRGASGRPAIGGADFEINPQQTGYLLPFEVLDCLKPYMPVLVA